MATRVSTALRYTTADDINFRATVQFVEDTLVATGGWVVTSDTGQTTPATMSHPTAPNQKVGYRIYRMNDALQATKPVFMRVDYGAAPPSGPPFGMWVTLGPGSDGAGAIIPKWLDTEQVNWSTNVTSPTQPTNSYGSASTGRVSLALFIQAVSSVAHVFCLERTKNSLGADTGDGLLLIYNDGAAAGVNASRYITFGSSAQPTKELGLNYILTSINPSQTYGGDIGVGVISPMKGVAQQPGLNVVIVNSGDMGVEAQFNVTLYGTTHTYQQCGSLVAPRKQAVGNNPSTNDANARVGIRYD